MLKSKFPLKWLSYSCGFLGIMLINNALINMLIYRYDPGLPNPQNLPSLVSSALVGTAMLFSGIIGALTQPVIGYLSDHYWSRWGHRHLFLAIAILPLVFSFILLFNPPLGYPKNLNLAYLVLLLCLFYLSLAVYQVPYLTWLSELAYTAKQRINLSSMMAIFGLIGAAISGIGAPWLTDQYSFQGMALVIGIFSLVALGMPLMVREDSSITKSKNPSFWKSLKLAWLNPSFRIYMTGIVTAWISVSILSMCPTFLAVALLQQDISFAGVLNGIVLGSAVSGFAIVVPLARSWGKGVAFEGSMLWFGCGILALSLVQLWLGINLLYWLALLLFSNLGLAGFFLLPNAMLPDVIDQGGKYKEQRQEAIYFGIRGLLIEVSRGIGAWLIGILLMLGKTPTHPWGIQLALFVVGLFALISAWAFSQYPLKD